MKQGAVEFCLYGAAGRGTGEAGQTDFLRDAGTEFQHEDEVPVGWLDCWEGGNAEFIAAVKQPRYAGALTNDGTDEYERGD